MALDFNKKTYNVILLRQWGQYNCGDIVEVSSGLFFTMMDTGMAIQLEDLENEECDLDDYSRMAIHSKIVIDDNIELIKENEILTDKNERLREKVAELEKKTKVDPEEEKRLFYKNKMNSNLQKKTNGNK